MNDLVRIVAYVVVFLGTGLFIYCGLRVLEDTPFVRNRRGRGRR
jgi:hypothetical protein